MNAVGYTLKEPVAETTDDTGDMDALHILPLRVLPFRNEKIGRARLIKNSHLTGVLEIYSTRETGSGQIPVERLPEFYGIRDPLNDPDMRMVLKLGPLPSYDVYSLRRSLRGLGIEVNSCKALRLSEHMQRSLTNYMTRFTGPLIRQVYGDADCQVQRFDDLLTLFRDPDPKKALAKLRQMAERLHIPLDYIPKFIEDYGDIFLALSYYHHCLDGLAPLLDSFQAGLTEMRTYNKVRSSPQLLAEIDRIEKTIAGLMSVLRRMFQDFGVRSRDMWDDMSAAKFKHVKDVVEGAQTTVGGVLCGLTVKLNAWYQRFPNPKAGGPTAREEFLFSEFKPGLSGIVAVARGQGEVLGLN